MGKFAPEQGCIELYDQEGACAHLTVGPGFVTDILPMVLNGEETQLTMSGETAFTGR